MYIRKFVLGSLGVCVIAPAVLLACGGGNDDDGGSSSSSGSGSDESYVAAFCDATLQFSDDLIAAIEEIGVEVEDEEAAAKALAKPIETLVAGLKKAKPPSDAKKAHDEIVSKLAGAAKELKDGKNAEQVFDALESPKLDDDVAARLDAVAEKNDACVESGVTFTNVVE